MVVRADWRSNCSSPQAIKDLHTSKQQGKLTIWIQSYTSVFRNTPGEAFAATSDMANELWKRHLAYKVKLPIVPEVGIC